jgi:hypothetical protein
MSQAALTILRASIINAVAANMLANYDVLFRKAGIRPDCAFNLWSVERSPAVTPPLL